jgi:hypothetical protein
MVAGAPRPQPETGTPPPLPETGTPPPLPETGTPPPPQPEAGVPGSSGSRDGGLTSSSRR